MSVVTPEKTVAAPVPVRTGVSPALLRAVNLASPFGQLPENYPYLATLCKKGFVRHKDEILKHPIKLVNGELKRDAEGKVMHETSSYRNWSIVSDASNGHMKFCMMLDFLEHRAMSNMFKANITQKIDRINLINVAIGVETGVKLSDGSVMQIDVKRLENMSWRAIKSYLANEGVKGYMTTKNAHNDTELIADEFENGSSGGKRAFL